MEEKAGAEQFAALMQLVATLRGENGCPWDRAQTPASMKKYLLEECQELIEAIDSGDAAAVREESGDLLFILIMLVQIFAEDEIFTMQSVCEDVYAKMVRRHPHVFAGAKVHSEEELMRQWEKIKAEEKKHEYLR